MKVTRTNEIDKHVRMPEIKRIRAFVVLLLVARLIIFKFPRNSPSIDGRKILSPLG